MAIRMPTGDPRAVHPNPALGGEGAPAIKTPTIPPVAVDTSKIATVETEPGVLPPTMAAWVIREERFGEPVGCLPARGDRGP